MAQFRYIPSAFESASGFLSTYEHKKDKNGNPIPDLAVEVFNKIRDKVRSKGMDIGVLSNAFTEVPDLIGYDKILSPEDITTYSDSGGLQVMTRGLEVTDEIKDKIYKDQRLYSDLAMCFDELPVRTLGERGDSASSMIDNSGRYYIDSLFQTDGTATGKNVLAQIKQFKAVEGKGKVLIILQGKDFQTLREFAWFLFQEIKDEPNYEDYIAGLAVGNTTAFGNEGLTDTILRFKHELEFVPNSIKRNIHILGAGTINKIFSFFLVPDDYWTDSEGNSEFILSADSTTQTKAMQFGKYISFDEEKLTKVDIQTGRELSEDVKAIITDIFGYHSDILAKFNTDAVCETTFKDHYTQYNEGLTSHITQEVEDFLRLREQFGPKDTKNGATEQEVNDARYDYFKRSIFSKYFWTMKMINDYFDHLLHIKENADLINKYDKAISLDKVPEEKMDAVLKARHDAEDKINKLLKVNVEPGEKSFNPFTRLLKIKTHEQYMTDETILVGHPYVGNVVPQEILDMETLEKIVVVNGVKYITDEFEGNVYARELTEHRDLKIKLNPNTYRQQILYNLSKPKLEIVPDEDWKPTTIDLDEW